MPIPTNPELLKMPFAVDGDKNSIPETTSPTTGLFSQQYGFQNINSLPLTAGGKAISRLDYNGAMYMLSNLLYYMQRGYTFVYDDDMPYVQGCRVMDPNDGQIYTCTADAAAGTGAPSVTPANWELSPSAAVLGYRQPDTEYDEDAIAFHPSLPTGYYLECTTGGTTSSGALTISGTITPNATIVTDGTVTWLVCSIKSAVQFNTKQTFTSSGTFTAPVTGTYKITLQGGGGGGSGSTDECTGNGGAQGGHGVFYEKLVAGTSYSFTVGAGGTGGSPHASGTNGGASSITINSNAYVANGGEAGVVPYGGTAPSTVDGYSSLGGTFTVNGVVMSRGINACAGRVTSVTSRNAYGGIGGGPGGGNGDNTDGIFGGGGAGGRHFNHGNYAGTAGGDGYITFEYCSTT